MTAAPVDFDSMFGISATAWDFYREHADDAETIDPEDACTSPTRSWPRRWRSSRSCDPVLAGRIILEWRRAQIAHMGVNPDTGVNVVAEREEVQALIAGQVRGRSGRGAAQAEGAGRGARAPRRQAAGRLRQGRAGAPAQGAAAEARARAQGQAPRGRGQEGGRSRSRRRSKQAAKEGAVEKPKDAGEGAAAAAAAGSRRCRRRWPSRRRFRCRRRSRCRRRR